MRCLDGFKGAVGLLTIFPVKGGDLESSFYFFPFVGLLIGLLELLVAYVFKSFPKTITSLLILSSYLIITGCFHIDGFTDAFDGLAHGRDREGILKIMKDSRIGSFGVAALFMLLSFKVFSIYELLSQGKIYLLLLPHAYSRWTVIFLCSFFPSAKKEGLGYLNVSLISRNKKYLLYSTGFVLFLFLLFDFSLFAIFLLLLPLVWAFGIFWRRRIGGITGDILGCSIEIFDMIFLILLVLGG